MVLFTSSKANTEKSIARDINVGIIAELIRLRHTLDVLDHKGFTYFRTFGKFLTKITDEYLGVLGTSKLKIDTGHVESGDDHVPFTKEPSGVFGRTKPQVSKPDTKHVESRVRLMPEETCVELTLNAFKSQYLLSQKNKRTQRKMRLPPNCPPKLHKSTGSPIAKGAHAHIKNSHTTNDVLPAYSPRGALPSYTPPKGPQ